MIDILGVILCGGKASRLGGAPKHALTLGTASFLEMADVALRQELTDIALSVKCEDQHPELSAYSRIPDTEDDGVASAILSSLTFARKNGYKAILTIPIDTPLLPRSFTNRVISAANETSPFSPVCASTDKQIHGLHALWPTECLSTLCDLINNKGIKRISKIHESIGSRYLNFGPEYGESFLNVNTAEAYKLAKSVSSGLNLETLP